MQNPCNQTQNIRDTQSLMWSGKSPNPLTSTITIRDNFSNHPKEKNSQENTHKPKPQSTEGNNPLNNTSKELQEKQFLKTLIVQAV